MNEKYFIKELFDAHHNKASLPSPLAVNEFIDTFISVLFPAYCSTVYVSEIQLERDYQICKEKLALVLEPIQSQINSNNNFLVETFFSKIPDLYYKLLKDAEAIESGDPAAKSREEVIRTYPGFYAIAIYRIAHELHKLNVPFIPRILTEVAHSKTGIDIHPGASIGEYFFIDYRTGVVVGETTLIGNHVKLYQGVTLGALSVSKNMAQTKRHPTIEDNVVIYAGATILGGRTIIGKNSVIGGNVWLTESLPANSQVYHQPRLNIEKSKHIMAKLLDFIGNTPLVELSVLNKKKNVKLFAKLEGHNPGGSVKDRAAFGLI